MMKCGLDKENKMNDQERKAYCAPAIVLEMELETRTGSPLMLNLDEFFEGEE